MVPSSVLMNTWKSNESMLIFCSIFKQTLLSAEHRIIDLIALISTITRFVAPIHAAWWNINFFLPALLSNKRLRFNDPATGNSTNIFQAYLVQKRVKEKQDKREKLMKGAFFSKRRPEREFTLDPSSAGVKTLVQTAPLQFCFRFRVCFQWFQM